MIKFCFNLLVAIIFIFLTCPEIGCAQDNEVEFDNQSGQHALVKLIGPTPREVDVPNYSKRSVTALSGNYYIMVRYGTTGNYHFTKGDKFKVRQTATKRSKITITLHKVDGGNYDAKPISESEFAALHASQKPKVTSKDCELVAYSDGTILDSRAKLMWKRDTSDKTLTWEQARTYCEELDYAGYTDWRLPMLVELQGLYNPNNNNHIEARSSLGKMQILNRCTNLINLHWTLVWASDRRAEQAAHINFSDGKGYGSTLDKRHYVLPVRNIGMAQTGVKEEGKTPL